MSANQVFQVIGQAVVIGTITGLACNLVQWLMTGEVNPAITAGVTGAVTAALVTSLNLGKGSKSEHVVETE